MSDETRDAAGVEFTDSDGVHWEVRQIPAPVLKDGTVSATFGEYSHGWLLFSSPLLKKRLTPYPDDWRDLTPYELEKWCWRARAERKSGGAPTGQSPVFEVGPDSE